MIMQSIPTTEIIYEIIKVIFMPALLKRRPETR